VIATSVEHYEIRDDEGIHSHILKGCLQEDPSDTSYTNVFEIVEEPTAISDEYEEEEFKRIERNTQVCTDPKVYDACCDVALAYQLSQIQKFLRDSGADIELVVHKDFIAINDENCKEYRGNVEQILRYIKASGELAKVADEMDRRN
tara:strand:+ start:50071 stop:50511 length:441 start_codon:yes stop_codon:yes gene_type:complete